MSSVTLDDPGKSAYDSAPAPDPMARWYDRSSITADAMVMIVGQTPEDFEKYAPEGRFCDYIDGIVYMPSPVTHRHQDHTIFLCDLINGFRHERGGIGKVMMGPAVLRISPRYKPEPDLFVEPPTGSPPGGPPATLVIEVFSPSTAAHDLGRKLDVYRDARIAEIVLVDELRSGPPALIVERSGDGGYRRETIESGYWISSSLPGFWLDAAWLWSLELPNPRQCLRSILAGPPGA